MLRGQINTLNYPLRKNCRPAEGATRRLHQIFIINGIIPAMASITSVASSATAPLRTSIKLLRSPNVLHVMQKKYSISMFQKILLKRPAGPVIQYIRSEFTKASKEV